MTTISPSLAPQRLDYAGLMPAGMAGLARVDKGIRDAGLDPLVKALVEVRASQINGCGYCLSSHSGEAREAGASQQQLDTLAGWRESPAFTPEQRAALAFAEAVTLVADTHVPDDVWDAAAERFDEQQLAALLFTVATVNAWNRIGVAVHLSPEPE